MPTFHFSYNLNLTQPFLNPLSVNLSIRLSTDACTFSYNFIFTCDKVITEIQSVRTPAMRKNLRGSVDLENQKAPKSLIVVNYNFILSLIRGQLITWKLCRRRSSGVAIPLKDKGLSIPRSEKNSMNNYKKFVALVSFFFLPCPLSCYILLTLVTQLGLSVASKQHVFNPLEQWFSTFCASSPGWRQIFSPLPRSQFFAKF